MSSLELFYKKLNDAAEFPENEAMHWGKALEELIANRWEYWEGTAESMIKNYLEENVVRRCRKINAYIINPEYPFLFASLDRVINQHENKKEGALEIKTISGFATKQWEHGIPPSYVAQLQQQLICSDLEYGEIAMLKDGRYMDVIPFERSAVICEKILLHTSAFWQKVLKAREIMLNENAASVEEVRSENGRKEIHTLEPEPDGSESYGQFLSNRYVPEPIIITGDDGHLRLAKQYVSLGERGTQIEEEQRLCSNKIKAHMEAAEVMDFGAAGKVTWKPNAKGTRVFNVRLATAKEKV
jgi:predicted phage-related endonuclease